MVRKIAVLASGNGSNAERIIRYFQGNPQVCVGLVVSNKPKARVLDRARALGVPGVSFSKEFWADGQAVLSLLQSLQISFVVLAGFLVRIPSALLQAYPNRMINIHPSLLPLHGGQGMYGDRVHEDVLRCGDSESGITIHYTNEQYDAGQIIAQYKCPVLPGDTFETLAERVHALEYAHYPVEIEKLLR